MVSREKIHELVKIFYQPTYKTFYINSEDGKDFEKPKGVFVSLGMTTSWKTLENIRDFIGNSKDFNATIVEISSKRVDGQYLNTIINSTDPKQYRLGNIPETVMTKDEVFEELENLKSKMSLHTSLEELTEYSHRINKLQYLTDKLTESNGWDSHMIQREGDLDYRIFHLYVNYIKREGIEYRIGIFVDEETD